MNQRNASQGVEGASNAPASDSPLHYADAPHLSPTTGLAVMDSGDRFFYIAVLVGVAIVLGVAIYLRPDPTGMGTHRQLGLPACGFVRLTGKPCLTCGFTTTFSLGAHLRWAEAARNQPAGFALFLVTLVSGVRSALALWRRWPVQRAFPDKITTPVFIGLLILTPAIWVLRLTGVL